MTLEKYFATAAVPLMLLDATFTLLLVIKAHIHASSSATQILLAVFFSNLVFTKLPVEKVEFKKGTTEVLFCEMKAPSDSVVYWTQKQLHKEECLIPTLNESVIATALCNTTSAVVNMSVKEIDNNYSMFHLELQVRQSICRRVPCIVSYLYDARKYPTVSFLKYG